MMPPMKAFDYLPKERVKEAVERIKAAIREHNAPNECVPLFTASEALSQLERDLGLCDKEVQEWELTGSA